MIPSATEIALDATLVALFAVFWAMAAAGGVLTLALAFYLLTQGIPKDPDPETRD